MHCRIDADMTELIDLVLFSKLFTSCVFQLFDPMMKKKKKKKVDLEDFENVPSSQPEPDTNKENEKAEANEESQSKKKEAGIKRL